MREGRRGSAFVGASRGFDGAKSSSDAPLAWAIGIVTALLLALVAFQGWGPQDAGTSGNAALWILEGQIPHVDFHDVYPGLLGFIHAGFFAVFGPSIRSLQIALLVSAGGAAASIYVFFRKLSVEVHTAAMAACGSVALAWVMYPVALPSWWNVTLTAASLALLTTGESTHQRGRVIAAGLLTGASALVKTTGILIAIPAVMWLLSRDERRGRYTLELASVVGVGSLAALASRSLTTARLVLIWIPAIAALILVYSRRELRRTGGFERSRGDSFWVLYAAGVVLPIAVVMFGYLAIGALPDLIEGWVVAPAQRLSYGSNDPPLSVVALLLLVGLIGTAWLLVRRVSALFAAMALTATAGIWFLLDRASVSVLVIGFFLWVPMLLCLWLLARPGKGDLDHRIVLTVAVSVVFAVVQVPLWFAAYTAFIIPLTLTAALLLGGERRLVFALPTMFLALVLVAQSASGFMYGPIAAPTRIEWVELDSSRGGVAVPQWHAYYNVLLSTVREVAGASGVYATPDSPEVSFLAETTSFNRSLWEELDPDWSPDLVVDAARDGVTVVVNHDPVFSPPIPVEDLAQIYSLLPESRSVGNFEVRWRPSVVNARHEGLH